MFRKLVQVDPVCTKCEHPMYRNILSEIVAMLASRLHRCKSARAYSPRRLRHILSSVPISRENSLPSEEEESASSWFPKGRHNGLCLRSKSILGRSRTMAQGSRAGFRATEMTARDVSALKTYGRPVSLCFLQYVTSQCALTIAFGNVGRFANRRRQYLALQFVGRGKWTSRKGEWLVLTPVSSVNAWYSPPSAT